MRADYRRIRAKPLTPAVDEPSPCDSTSADIAWNADGEPVSRVFADVYFNSASGIDESRFVFLRHNNLQARWQRLKPGALFTIAETGFGSGLNFLNAWQAWLRDAPADATLHFISVERYPLLRADLQRALHLVPELQEQALQLIEQYPPVDARGFHRLNFGRVRLTLIFADAYCGLQQMLPIVVAGPRVARLNCGWTPTPPRRYAVDAWFLDGFAPACNPRMWSHELLQLIGRLSGDGTTLTTGTSASAVCCGLKDAGFHVTKLRGFGHKREIIRAIFQAAPAETVTPDAHPPPAAPDRRRRTGAPSWHLSAYHGKAAASVAVIGAGLAGCHTAFALAELGIKVTLLDRANVAAGASGNPQGIVYSKFSSSPGALADFNITALTYALRFYHQRGFFRSCGDACGVLQIAENERQVEQYKAVAALLAKSPELAIWLDPSQANITAGVPIEQGALWLPQAGWLNPALLCRTLVAHPNIELLPEQEVETLDLQRDRWHLLNGRGESITTAPAVVIACADSAHRFSQCSLLPTKAIRGQVSLASATRQSQSLRTVLCGSGYIAPANDHGHCLGASFNLTSTATDVRWDEHQSNLQQVQILSPAFDSLKVAQREHGRASLRCTSPDYLPIVGPVPRQADMIQRFAIYRKNLNAAVDAPGEYWPGLYLNIAHGSKGLTYTPICAELLAGMIAGHPLPLPRDLILRVHSARLLIRDLSRRRL